MSTSSKPSSQRWQKSEKRVMRMWQCSLPHYGSLHNNGSRRAPPSVTSSATRKRSPLLSKPSAWIRTLLWPTTTKVSPFQPLGRKKRLNKHTKWRDDWASAARNSLVRDRRKTTRLSNYIHKVFPSLH